VDVGVDVGFDVGVDVGFDVGVDVGFDVGFDVGVGEMTVGLLVFGGALVVGPEAAGGVLSSAALEATATKPTPAATTKTRLPRVTEEGSATTRTP
jgi:hypothetical protein